MISQTRTYHSSYFLLNQKFITTAAVLLYAKSGVLSAPLCLTGDFDSQLRHILQKQMLSTQDQANIISRVLDDVQPTLNQRWQGYEVFLCGSLVTGLATISSDVDLYIKLPNFNSSAGLYVLEETEKLLKKQPTLYSQIIYKNSVICSIIIFFHIPTQLKVDIEFDTGDIGVSNSKLIRYYFKIDKRFLPLGGILKIWFKLHGLSKHGTKPNQTQPNHSMVPNYALYLLIIFYLQQKNMAPPGYMLQIDSKSHIIDNWDVGFNELPYSSGNTENLHQLLGGFFKYYSEFNFNEYIVSPFTGRPIRRNAFKDIKNFPKEYSLYNNSMKRTMQLKIKKYLNINTDLCVQDVFMQDSNIADKLSHELAMKFKNLMKSVAKMFEDLPRDSFLRAILVTDQHNDNSHKNASVGGLNGQHCIEVTGN